MTKGEIAIAARLRPFSHMLGAYALLPGTFFMAKAYPSMLMLFDIRSCFLHYTIEFSIKGPLSGFTLQQDLEKSLLKVWGEKKSREEKQLFRYHLSLNKERDALALSFERLLEEKLNITFVSHMKGGGVEELSFQEGEQFILPPFPAGESYPKLLKGRLSLGNHKAQNWDRVIARRDLAEILPAWYSLGVQIPKPSRRGRKGTLQLLSRCEEALAKGDRLEVEEELLNLFLAGFSGILSPRLIDDHLQGIVTYNEGDDLSDSDSLSLLHDGANIIKRLFVSFEEDACQVLPCLPTKLLSGRFVNIDCGEKGRLDIEWTKGFLRRMIFSSKQEQQLTFSFQKKLKTFRLRRAQKEKGEELSCGTTLSFEKGKRYYFDNFQK